MKIALKAAAQLADINIRSAVTTVRHNPLFDEEIHIEEELINLEEVLATRTVAENSLTKYPKVRRHMMQERKEVLEHCVGLIIRMLQGRRLPRRYSEKDTEYAITKLVRLIVDEARRIEKEIDEDVMDIIRPFLSWRQRIALREWSAPSLRVTLQFARRKFFARWQTS